MKPDRIELTSRMNAAELASALENHGVLRVDKNSAYEKNGVKHIFLRERTILEAVQDFFTLDSAARTKPALDALAAIQSVIQDKRNAGQLLQNIQDRIEHKGSFSGRSIVRDLDQGNRSVSGKIMPLEGGTAVAESMGQGVHILQKNPMLLKSNLTFVRTSSASQYVVLTTTENKRPLGFFHLKPQNLATENLILLNNTPSLIDEEDWGNYVKIFEDSIKNMLLIAAKSEGAIVLEISPAMFATGEEKQSEKRQKELFSIVIRQVNDSLEKTRNNMQKMAITFAGEDLSLLTLFKSHYEADRLGLNKATKSELSDQEDLSESDDDDGPLLLGQNYVTASLARLRAEESEQSQALKLPDKIQSSHNNEDKKS